MSQVRKLLKGQNIPKAQQGYKFQLDSQTYNVTDEQLKEIDDRISKLSPEHRRFLGNWTNAIKSGSSSGNRAENTVTMNMLSGVEGKDVDRLKRQKGSFWETLAGTDSYYAKEAINEALSITHSVLNKPVTTTPTTKTKRYNRAANFDYDKDASGKYVYSTNPKNKFIEDRFAAYLDWLSDEKWGDSNEWETPLGDNEAILRSWYNGLGDREKAQAVIDAAMSEVRSKPWDEVSEATKELLAYFNIGNGSTQDDSNSGESGNTALIDVNGNIDTSARTDKGEFRTWHGTGKDKDKLFTNSTIGDSKPYLLNADRLRLYGLGDDYLNSVLYKGRIYKPEEVSQNVDLQDIMNRVVTANNSARSTKDVWENVGALLNFTDYADNYTEYNSDSYYMPYQNRELRGLLGSGNYSLADITNAYETGGNNLFEIYDFNDLGTNTWGFRAPKYYSSGTNMLLDYIPLGYTFLNRNWNPMNGYSNWTSVNGTDYGLVGSFWGADAHDTMPYQIFEDRQGNFWTKLGNGKMQQLDVDLVEWVLNGNKPNHNQMLHGTLSGKKRNTPDRMNVTYPNASFKQGGKVQLKPLPAKLQMGSRLSVAPNQPEQATVQEDTPLAHASNVWETLTPADQKEITAAAIDVAGAIAGLVPGGSIAGAVSGLGSTGLFLSAAKDRKGHRDAGDWGQAVIATGLDLVSLVPYLGETGKIAKIAKSVTRVVVPLGKAFNALGLVEASSVLTKNPKDWDTNDLLKLSAGIQSVINVGHSAHVRRGESALASEITKIKSKEKLPEVKYSSKKFKGTDGKPIELESAAIERITDKNNKNPGQTLRAELQSKGVSDEALKDVTDDALLEQFGFIVGKKGVAKWQHTTAKQQPQPTKEEYTKNGWVSDMFFDPLGKNEFKRREYIDRNLQDTKVRAGLAKLLRNPSTILDSRNITTPREVITISSHPVKNTAAGRAYVQSLARLGKAQTSWTGYPKGVTIEQSTIDRRPGLKLDAEAAMSSGEGLPSPASKLAKSTSENILKALNTPESVVSARTTAAVSKVMGPKPGISNKRLINLGPESVSNRDLRKYIIGNATEKGLTETEAVEFLNGLSERKRNSLLKDLQKSKSKKAEAILSHFIEESPVQSVARKVYSTPAMQNISERNGIRRATRKSERTANNIHKLMQSNDPMKTLRELTESDKNFAQQVFDNQEEFQAALNFALSRMSKGRKSKYSKEFRDYVDELYGFLDQNNLTIFTKNGGIIKAYDGIKLDGPLFHSNETNYELLGVKPLGNYSVQDYKFDPNWKPSSLSVSLDGPLFPSTNNTTSSSIKTPNIGGFNKNLPNLTRYLIPGLSLGRFALNSHFQNKYYRQAVDALNAGRVDKLPTVLNTPRQDSPALDRQLQQVHLERMAGMKPSTSDLVANNALWNQREDQLWNREQDIIGQQSQFGWNAQREAMNIMNQNLANQIETANDNAMRRAAVNSAIKQQAMELTQRRGQSWENLGLEIENNLKKDLDIMTDYRKSQEESRLQKVYDKNIDSIFGAEARNKYRSLSADEAVKYTDFEDYLSRSSDYSDLYRQNVDTITGWQNDMSENMQKWMYLNALNYRYPRILTGRTSTVGYKKGGYLRGSTRYTMEPDERIWVENNKATHKAIAKLSDNTIKLLLRALK